MYHSSSRFQIRVYPGCRAQKSCALEPPLPSDAQNHSGSAGHSAPFCKLGPQLLQSFTNDRVSDDSVYGTHVVAGTGPVAAHCEQHSASELLCEVENSAGHFVLAGYARLSVACEEYYVRLLVAERVELVLGKRVGSVLRDVDAEVAVWEEEIAGIQLCKLFRFQFLYEIVNGDFSHVAKSGETLD